jgi:hypothetical protein
MRKVMGAIALAISVYPACVARPDTAKQGAVARAMPECDSSLMILASDVHVEFANEWENADLFVSGRRDELRASSAEQRQAVVSWLNDEAKKNPEDLRTCKALSSEGPPKPALIGEARKRLPALTDWCWHTRAASF